jgi:hypothetical protein
MQRTDSRAGLDYSQRMRALLVAIACSLATAALFAAAASGNASRSRAAVVDPRTGTYRGPWQVLSAKGLYTAKATLALKVKAAGAPGAASSATGLFTLRTAAGKFICSIRLVSTEQSGYWGEVLPVKANKPGACQIQFGASMSMLDARHLKLSLGISDAVLTRVA